MFYLTQYFSLDIGVSPIGNLSKQKVSSQKSYSLKSYYCVVAMMDGDCVAPEFVPNLAELCQVH